DNVRRLHALPASADRAAPSGHHPALDHGRRDMWRILAGEPAELLGRRHHSVASDPPPTRGGGPFMATWDLENAAHLLRRAAFGGTPEEIKAFHDRHSSVAEAVNELLNFGPSARKPPAPNDVSDDGRLKMQRWWIKQMAKSPNPATACREKLV